MRASAFAVGHTQEGRDGSLYKVECEWERRKHCSARGLVTAQGSFVHFWVKC